MIVRAFLLATTIISASACGANAENAKSTLKPAPDSGTRVVAYSPFKRYEIVEIVGQPVTISFPEGESVYRVGMALKFDTDPPHASWRAPRPEEVRDHPLGNNLILMPEYPGVGVATVITAHDAEGHGQKTYSLRLIAKPAPDEIKLASDTVTISDVTQQPELTHTLLFNGGKRPLAANSSANSSSNPAGEEPRPRRSSTRKQRELAAAEEDTAKERLRTDAFNGAGGCHYVKQPAGPSTVEPRCPLDNGIWTLMRFPGLSAKPTAYAGRCDGKDEHLARQHGAGDFLVVETIAPSFCLRLGSAALNIINTAYDPAGSPTGTGTLAPTVVRDVIQETKGK